MTRLALFLTLLILSAPAQGQSVLGLWLSPPDHKGRTGHVEMKPCGTAICGTLLRAFDKSGAPIVTKNVGKRLIWDMMPAAPDGYRGQVFVPLMNSDFPAEMTVKGDLLEIHGCNSLGLCKSQSWSRVN